MDYLKIYNNLIENSYYRITFDRTERHHIIPRSFGGSDDLSNIAYLTIKEHFLAHLLLYKIGYTNQAFSLEAILQDTLDKCSYRYNKIRYKKYYRKIINKERQKLFRELRKGYNE